MNIKKEYGSQVSIVPWFEILRGGGSFGKLEAYGAATVQYKSDSELKMSISGSFFKPETQKPWFYVTPKTQAAEYGFSQNEDGWWVSANGGVPDSEAVLRFDFDSHEEREFALSIEWSSEKGYDYCIICKLDSTNEQWETLGYNDSGEGSYKFTTTIPSGKHFLHIKYVKDYSTDHGDDCIRVKILTSPEGDGVNWASDRLKAWVSVNGVDYPMGVYVPTTLMGRHDAAGDIVEIEAYSLLYLAKRTKLEETLVFRGGENYIGCIQTLLRLAGITWYEADSTEYTLSCDREWEVGTEVLTIINELLSEINFRSAWVDLCGKVRLTKYSAPDHTNIKHIYNADEYSVISEEYTLSNDSFGKANVFRCVCSNPDLSGPFVATSENSDPKSAFSTVNVGARILHIENVDNIPSQAALQEKANELLVKSKLTTEEIEFETALIPEHEAFDVVALDNGGLTGIFEETEWSCSLEYSGKMTHRAKRVIL